MTQKDLVAHVTDRLGWDETNTNKAVDAFIEIISQELITGNRVDISGFGLFQAKKQSEYILIDEGTGERYLMPPYVEVVFETAIGASGPEVPAGNALNYIPDTALEEEANSSFSLFKPTLIAEGVIFPGLAEVVDSDTEVVDSDTEVVDSDTEVVDSDTEVVDSDTQVLDSDRQTVSNQKGLHMKRRARSSLRVALLAGFSIAIGTHFIFRRGRRRNH